jgi:hypothetical protein
MAEWEQTTLETEDPHLFLPHRHPILSRQTQRQYNGGLGFSKGRNHSEHINAGNVPNKVDIAMISAAAFYRDLTQKNNVAFSVTICEINQILAHRE